MNTCESANTNGLQGIGKQGREEDELQLWRSSQNQSTDTIERDQTDRTEDMETAFCG